MRERSGFTILELVLALTLIAVVAAVAIPSYFQRSDVTLENACVLLARDLRGAQNRAAYLGRATRVEFLADGDGYRATEAGGRTVRDPRSEEPFERRYSADGVFEGVVVVDVRFGGGRTVLYDERGSAVLGGEITLAFGPDTRTLVVEPLTGLVTIVGSTSGWSDLGY
jgi:type IV fimbrial biogenesis protein FimT